MRIESLITKEVLALLKDNKFITIKPYKPKARLVPRGTLSPLYPLHEYKGDVGKYHPSKPPRGYTLGNGNAFENARIFGCKSWL